MKQEFRSVKSGRIYTVEGEKSRAFVTVSGEAANNRKAKAEVERIRKSGATWDEAVWTARMLAKTY